MRSHKEGLEQPFSLALRVRKISALGALVSTGAILPTPALSAKNSPLKNVAAVEIQTKEIGVVSDLAEQLDPSRSEQAVSLIQWAGFNALKETVQIATGQQGFRAMNENDQTKINNSLDAAQEAGLPVTLYLWSQSWIKHYQPPVTPNQQRGFCKVGAQIIAAHPGVVEAAAIGQEFNNPKFYKRQFNEDGSDAAAKSAEKLTAICYDTIKAVDPTVKIIGIEASASGNDDPNSKRPSHAPITFIKDFCQAYRDSGRPSPILDEVSVHYYRVAHQTSQTINGVTDYAKIQKALNCFESTGQPIPALQFGEGGDTTLESGKLIKRYGGKAPGGSLAVSETAQGQDFANDIEQVVCHQPNTTSIFNFQLIDDGSILDSGFGRAPLKLQRSGAGADITFQPKDGFSTIENAIIAYNSGTLCE